MARYRSALRKVCREHLNSSFTYVLSDTALNRLANIPSGLKMAVFTRRCCRITVKKSGKGEVIHQAVLSFCNSFKKQELYLHDYVLTGTTVKCVGCEQKHREEKRCSQGPAVQTHRGIWEERLCFSSRETLFLPVTRNLQTESHPQFMPSRPL